MIRLQARPASVGVARRAVADALADDVRVDEAVLMTSELVTNALLHGGPHAPDGELLFHLDSADGVVRIELGDNSTALPTIREASVTRPSGRGLRMIASLATAWGVTPNGAGKSVWFEIRS